MPTLEEEEGQFLELLSFYRGCAKIDLKHLTPDPNDTFNLDNKNIVRLEKILEEEGCLRVEAEHHVQAIISNSILESSLRESHLRRQDLHLPGHAPKLLFGTDVRLIVLHGKHRLGAASEFFSLPGERWWIVDLYDDRKDFIPLQVPPD